ncbi:MAG: hypothetical protein SPF18_05315 [Blautia sp.]|nr:hypothetical protein [Blautia sp.]
MIKGAKTIAEYAIRKWLQQNNFDMQYFILKMEGNKGILEDTNNDKLILEYDSDTGIVSVEGTV